MQCLLRLVGHRNLPSLTLSVKDSRSGTQVRAPITGDTVPSALFSESFGLSVYDNGYLNTAVCRSSISYIDGDKGILRYRGYDIEDLAENASFLEVSYLLLYGDLPSPDQFELWSTRIMRHTYIHENMVEYLKSFRYDAHPMGQLVSSVRPMSFRRVIVLGL